MEGKKYESRQINLNSFDSSWISAYGYGNNGIKNYYDHDYDYGTTKTRHKFTPVLLVWSTVYNCKLCGAKKEECKTDYCDDNKKKDDFDIGDWG